MYACDLKSAITNLLMRSEMILKAMDVQFSRIYFYDSHGKTIIILVKKNSKPIELSGMRSEPWILSVQGSTVLLKCQGICCHCC